MLYDKICKNEELSNFIESSWNTIASLSKKRRSPQSEILTSKF